MDYYITINVPIHLNNEDYSILSQAMSEYTKLLYRAYQLALGYSNGKKLERRLTRNEIYNILKKELKTLNTRYLLAAIADALKAKKSKLEKKKKLKFLILERLKLKPQIRSIGRKDRGCASSIRIDFAKKELIINFKTRTIIAKMKTRNYHEKWLNYLKKRVENKEISYTVRIIKIKNKPVAQITFPIFPIIKEISTRDTVIGVDFNPSFLAYAIVDRTGNLIKIGKIKFENDLGNNMSKGERVRILGKGIKQLIKLAKELNATIAIEDLQLYPVINKNKNKKIRQIPHRRFKEILISNSALHNIELVFINPAHTSNIAHHKYHWLKTNEHCIAAFVIARRALGIIEKIPIHFLEYKTFKKMIPVKWEIEKGKVNKTRIAWIGPYARFVR